MPVSKLSITIPENANKYLALLTGSRAYGEPTEDSDIDIVIRCGNGVYELLKKHSDKCADGSIRFGKLNIICCLENEQYQAWYIGTQDLVARYRNTDLPIERDKAKEYLNAVRKKLGIGDNYLEQIGG